MNRSTSGLVLSDPVADMQPLLDQWLKLYARSAAVFPQNRELWYVEQSLTALLVASAWTLGIPAVGEAKSQRVRLSRNSNGRIDMLVQFNNGPTAVECKIYWFNNMGGFETVLGKLEDAESDCRSIDSSFSGRRLALCYGVLEKGGDDIEDLLGSAINRSKVEGIDIIAWSIDASSPDSVQYPGCIVLGRVV